MLQHTAPDVHPKPDTINRSFAKLINKKKPAVSGGHREFSYLETDSLTAP